MNLRERLRALMPSREQIHSNRRLSWLAPWLRHSKLWHWSRRGVALGVALGVFFGLLIPIAQIPLSIATAVILRANVPAAAASTLISNPLTFGPLYYAAYRLGTWVTGDTMPPDADSSADAFAPEINADIGLWQHIASIGKPLMIGLSITATLMGLLTYGLITLIWRWRTLSTRRSRTRSWARRSP